MTRFDEYQPDITRHLAKLWEDPTPKQERCDDCRDFFPQYELHLIREDGQPNLYVCPLCKRTREEMENELENPRCTCSQTDADLFNARDCAQHNRQARPARIVFSCVREGVA